MAGSGLAYLLLGSLVGCLGYIMIAGTLPAWRDYALRDREADHGSGAGNQQLAGRSARTDGLTGRAAGGAQSAGAEFEPEKNRFYLVALSSQVETVESVTGEKLITEPYMPSTIYQTQARGGAKTRRRVAEYEMNRAAPAR